MLFRSVWPLSEEIHSKLYHLRRICLSSLSKQCYRSIRWSIGSIGSERKHRCIFHAGNSCSRSKSKLLISSALSFSRQMNDRFSAGQKSESSPVTGFPVGGHESATQQGAQPQHKAVVEVLSGGIERADQLDQQRLDLRFQPCVIAGEDGLLNGNRRGRRDQILQPLQNLLVIHQRNLPVGQGDLAHKIAAEGGRGFQCLQIAGHQQEAVNGGGIALDLRIDHAGVDEGGEGLAVDQGGQTVINLLVRLGKHFPDNIVAAGGDPEGSRLALVAEVVDHRPRVENLRLAEVGAVFVVQNGVDGQVIHPTEDTLLGHPQNAGEEAEGQVLIILEPAGKQVPHKPDDLVVIVLLIALLDRGVVLVALIAGQQFFVPPGLLCENIPDGRSPRSSYPGSRRRYPCRSFQNKCAAYPYSASCGKRPSYKGIPPVSKSLDFIFRSPAFAFNRNHTLLSHFLQQFCCF